MRLTHCARLQSIVHNVAHLPSAIPTATPSAAEKLAILGPVLAIFSSFSKLHVIRAVPAFRLTRGVPFSGSTAAATSTLRCDGSVDLISTVRSMDWPFADGEVGFGQGCDHLIV